MGPEIRDVGKKGKEVMKRMNISEKLKSPK